MVFSEPYDLYYFSLEHQYFLQQGDIRTWLFDMGGFRELAYDEKHAFRWSPDGLHLNPNSIKLGTIPNFSDKALRETFPEYFI